MRLPKFEFLEPQSIEEACSMLAAHEGESRALSGGTDLLALMKQRVVAPRYVVNLKSIPGLSRVEEDGQGGLAIGPLTTLRTMANSPVVKEKFPSLAEACERVASPLIRNSATIGGNVALDSKCWYYNQSHWWRQSWEPCLKRGGDVCHVVKGGRRCFSLLCADTVPALSVLGAELDLVSGRGRRTLGLDQFYTGEGTRPNVLEPDELIGEIRVPRQPEGSGAAFCKFAIRGSIDYGLVDVAAALTCEAGSGRCTDARVTVAAIGPGPVVATKAAQVLVGRELGGDVVEAAGAAAVEEARYISSIWAPRAYRRKAIRALVARAVRQAWGLAARRENAVTDKNVAGR